MVDASPDAAIDAPQPAVIPCSAPATATIRIDDKDYPFTVLGNVDSGGESACGGSHEAARISLYPMNGTDFDTKSFQLEFPIATGSRPIAIQGFGTGVVTATLDLAQVVVDGAGPDVQQIIGTLSDGATGTFSATHCAQLDETCI